MALSDPQELEDMTSDALEEESQGAAAPEIAVGSVDDLPVEYDIVRVHETSTFHGAHQRRVFTLTGFPKAAVRALVDSLSDCS